MTLSPFLTANIAASFITFARSAPLNPTVTAAIEAKLISLAKGLFLE